VNRWNEEKLWSAEGVPYGLQVGELKGRQSRNHLKEGRKSAEGERKPGQKGSPRRKVNTSNQYFITRPILRGREKTR